MARLFNTRNVEKGQVIIQEGLAQRFAREPFMLEGKIAYGIPDLFFPLGGSSHSSNPKGRYRYGSRALADNPWVMSCRNSTAATGPSLGLTSVSYGAGLLQPLYGLKTKLYL